MVIICDIDGTLANVTHRVHYLEKNPKDWDSFYEACDLDSPYTAIIELIKIMARYYEIVYVTGRRESTRDKTITWFRENLLPLGRLIMRADGDKRTDTELKVEVVSKNFNKDQILFVLEDRSSVVKMWREQGLTCLQVKEGDY